MHNNNPIITVIVPLYNAEKVMHRSIDSILNQSYTDFEVLIVDDGSTDGSKAICDGYAAIDKRVRVLHKENGGIGSARNMGLDNARGEWICFVDSDDYISSRYLEESIRHSSYDLITISFQETGATSAINGSKNIIVNTLPEDAHYILDFSPNDKSRTPMLLSWSHLFKKSTIDKYKMRFSTSLRFGEDTLFVIEYLQHCKKIIQLPDVLYYYTTEEDAFRRKYRMSAQDTNAHCQALTKTMEEYCDTYGCQIPGLYYCNFVTYLKAYKNYLFSERDFTRFCESLRGLEMQFSQLRYAGRKFPVMYYLMRMFPHISHMILKTRNS